MDLAARVTGQPPNSCMCTIGLALRGRISSWQVAELPDRLAPGRLTCVAPVPGSPGPVPLVPGV